MSESVNETTNPGAGRPSDVVAEVSPLTEAGESVYRLACAITRKRSEVLAKNPGLKPKPRRSIWASQIPDCIRQGVYEFTHWKEKKMFDPSLFSLFQMGHVNEAEFKRELIQLSTGEGWELVEDQSHIGDDMFQKYGISGYLDTKIAWEGRRWPVEMKLMSPFIFDKIDGINPKVMEKITPEFVKSGPRSMKRFPWTRKYIRQGQVYMLGTGEEAMMFALTDGRGNWKFVVLELDYDEAENLLTIAETIQKHRKEKTLPPRIDYDNDTCGRCPFIHICLPDIENDPSVKIIDNAQLHADIEEWLKLTDKGKRWKKLDDKIKEFGKGNNNQVCGDFVIMDKTGVLKKYDMPSSVKEKYRIKDGVSHRVTVQRLASTDPLARVIEPGRSIDIGADDE